MAALSFTQALEQAELLARQALPTVQHERLSCAVALVRNGKVLQHDDGHTWTVESGSKPDVTYSINGHGCQCEDATYRAPAGRCKHVLATLLARKALALMRQPQKDALTTTDTTDQAAGPVDSHETPVVSGIPTPPLPEAPVSITLKAILHGHETLITLRGHDFASVQGQVAQALDWLKAETPVQASRQGEGWCSIHAVQMQLNQKAGRSWWSHKTADGWCKGKGGRP